MKQKTHSGLKKRVKVKKSGTVMVQKPCKKHLLDNKSKKQKRAYKSGMPVTLEQRETLRKLMPGKVGTAKVKKVEAPAMAKETPVKVKTVKIEKAKAVKPVKTIQVK